MNISKMFGRCISLSYLPNLSVWNFPPLHEKYGIFEECLSLTYLPDASSWQNDPKHEKIVWLFRG